VVLRGNKFKNKKNKKNKTPLTTYGDTQTYMYCTYTYIYIYNNYASLLHTLPTHHKSERRKGSQIGNRQHATGHCWAARNTLRMNHIRYMPGFRASPPVLTTWLLSPHAAAGQGARNTAGASKETTTSRLQLGIVMRFLPNPRGSLQRAIRACCCWLVWPRLFLYEFGLRS
jgi:hypothetical protein